MILDIFKAKMLEFAKSKDTDRLGVVRFFLAKVKNREIELRPQNIELTDEHVFKVLKKLVKQLDETIEICTKANKTEALAQAEKEKSIMLEFEVLFPAEMIQAAKDAEAKYAQFKKQG